MITIIAALALTLAVVCFVAFFYDPPDWALVMFGYVLYTVTLVNIRVLDALEILQKAN